MPPAFTSEGHGLGHGRRRRPRQSPAFFTHSSPAYRRGGGEEWEVGSTGNPAKQKTGSSLGQARHRGTWYSTHRSSPGVLQGGQAGQEPGPHLGTLGGLGTGVGLPGAGPQASGHSSLPSADVGYRQPGWAPGASAHRLAIVILSCVPLPCRLLSADTTFTHAAAECREPPVLSCVCSCAQLPATVTHRRGTGRLASCACSVDGKLALYYLFSINMH